ncbi:MAG: helix-turn-helix transcriptional regulator [Bacteroidales bacterium]|nr:helix-turn-helix transcriptional regulator [Bacteroidales bacterium]
MKKRLLEYLRSHRISQAEFGARMGVSRSYVSTMRESMSHDMLVKLRQEFPDLNPNWLMYGEGNMEISGSSNCTQIGQNTYNNNSSSALEKAIDEIAEQRKLTAASQSQVDRLLSIIETMQKARN